MRIMPLCHLCKRFNDDDSWTCEAYPNGIPEAVQYSGHMYPKTGDNGLQFIAKDKNSLLWPYDEATQQEENEAYQAELERLYEQSIPDSEWEDYIKKRYGNKWKQHRGRIVL